MNLVPAFSWLTRLRWQRLRPASQVDFADMGTAFGLDASMDSLPAAEPAAGMKRGRPKSDRRVRSGANGAEETQLYLGITTLSITWITPLSATMSVAVTLAPSTITPPAVASVSSEP